MFISIEGPTLEQFDFVAADKWGKLKNRRIHWPTSLFLKKLVYYHNTNFFFITNHFNHFSYYQDIANLQTSFIIILMKSCSTQALTISFTNHQLGLGII